MTNADDDPNGVPAAPDELAVVGAFLDGEDVSAQALRSALDDPQARDYLVDLLALRKSVGAMGPFSVAAASTPTSRRPRRWWGAVAAATVVTLASGYAVGEWNGARSASAPRASSHVEVVAFTPGVPAPAPTEVIQFVPGKNWHVTGGD